MDRKYQIFVSSTYEDLKEERNEVIKACLNMGHIPVGMEMFNAADEEQWAVITRTIDQCDYYVVIVAHRYGSTVNGISFTEREYDYAVEQGVPVLGFVIDSAAPWPNDRVDKDQAALGSLQRFKSKVKQKMVRSWRDKAELQAHFAMSLTTTINLNPRRGWVRAPEATDADIAQALSNLVEENTRLRQEVKIHQTSTHSSDQVEDIVTILESGQYYIDKDIVLKIGRWKRDGGDDDFPIDLDYEAVKEAIKRLKFYGVLTEDFDFTRLGHLIFLALESKSPY